jgi:alpha-tubulin suppressor-like RCC1 family protein
LTNAVAIATGTAHTCALSVNGTALCWGANGSGRLGDGTTADRYTPVAVTGLTSAVAIATGTAHTCVLRADGTARCWGSNGSGRLGDTTTDLDRLVPVAVRGLTNAVAIAAGFAHSCAILAEGATSCWGSNSRGQLGNGTASDSPTPTTVAGGAGSVVARAVAAGASHSCAVRADGTAACWGDNRLGQLGDQAATQQSIPAAVPGLTNAVAIAAGPRTRAL